MSSLIRQLSTKASGTLNAPLGAQMTPGISIVFMLNSMTGVSILTLPFAFAQAGFVLGMAVVILCMLLAFVTATFTCEAFTIANALHFREGAEAEEELLEVQSVGTESLASQFKIRERVEFVVMGQKLLQTRVMPKIIYAVIVAQMYGSNTVLVVLVNQALSHAICAACALSGVMLESMEVYRVCVFATFAVVCLLSMGDLQKTQKLTVVIMCFKFSAIFLFILVSGIHAFERYQQLGALAPLLESMPMWEISAFPAVFGNTVFMFCQHHMLPSMVAPVSPQAKIPFVIFVSFCIMVLLVSIINITALPAWDAEALDTCSAKPGGHFCRIQPMYNLNFAPLSWAGGLAGIFIVAYPAMGIANFPVQAITTRNTVHKMLGLPPAAEGSYTNILLLLGVLAPCFGVALITQDVQVMIKYVGGYAGLTIAFFFPVLLVMGGRLQLGKAQADAARPLKSRFASAPGYVTVAIFYLVALIIISVKLFVLPA